MEYFAISNGIPVHILDTKKGEKTILLLHGYLETLYIYNEFIEILQKKYRVIAIDLPGHGLSGSDKEINSMEFDQLIKLLFLCRWTHWNERILKYNTIYYPTVFLSFTACCYVMLFVEITSNLCMNLCVNLCMNLCMKIK